MSYQIRALTISEIIDGAFKLYRDNFGVFLGTAALTGLPAVIAASCFGLYDPTQFAAAGASDDLMVGRAIGILVGLPIWGCVYIIQQASLTSAIADAYLGRPVSLAGAFRRIPPLLGSLLGAFILYFLGVGIGLLLLVIPGIILCFRWFFITQAIVVDGKTAAQSLSRSAVLTNGRKGRLFALMFLLGLIQSAVSWGFQALVPASIESIPIMGAIILNLPTIVLTPLVPAVTTLAYFDARVRSEGFDLEILANGIGSPTPVVSAST
ncbi:MAG: hypothetical protein V2A73_08120 [Pseudomonadota bacterium]